MRSSYRALYVYFESDSDKASKGVTILFKVVSGLGGFQLYSKVIETSVLPAAKRCKAWRLISKQI